jgi:hypothetical protein
LEAWNLRRGNQNHSASRYPEEDNYKNNPRHAGRVLGFYLTIFDRLSRLDGMTTTPQDLFAGLTSVKQQVESYNNQRKQLVYSLNQIVIEAQQLLTQLGEGVTVPAAGRRRGRPPGSGKKRGPGRPRKNAAAAKSTGRRGRRKGTKMSKAARAKIAAAQKARWAKVRAEKGQ